MIQPAENPRAAATRSAAIDARAQERVQLIVALVVFLVSLATFIVLTIEVTHRGSLTLIDDALAADFHSRATATGVVIFGFVTDLGRPATVGFVGLVGIAMLAARRDLVVASGWAIALAGGAVIDEAVKHVIARPRPVFAAEHLTHLSYSFPSGHSIGSIIGYGVLAYVILLRVQRWDLQVLVVVLTMLLVLAVGFSRLYLDVHYFSDVLGGYAAGACWLCISVTATDVARRRVRRRRELSVASTASPR
ncbi:MAG TPA: phosphatase PAP2 family protein [Gemmatimonadaceae bacterium]|jgi:undecaprenyl-diphosphatase|nr:phosphatase PAP2 family protein [Gemmatimonadaceae bacterium]